jgi:hypothetical protein
MMTFKLLFVTISVSLLLLVLATAVIAQEEIPPPYAGLNNPFSWSDASVPLMAVTWPSLISAVLITLIIWRKELTITFGY